jgi:hypothetical protein
VIEAWLRQGGGCARGRLGAVSFVQRFGSTLNAHVHFHCCVIDGVFTEDADGQVQFAEAACRVASRNFATGCLTKDVTGHLNDEVLNDLSSPPPWM